MISNLLNRLLGGSFEAHRKAVENNLRNNWRTSKLDSYHAKAVSPEGEIMGYIEVVIIPNDYEDTEESGVPSCPSSMAEMFLAYSTKERDESGDDDIEFPVRDGLQEMLLEHKKAAMETWVKGRRLCIINGLFTLPKFQRRGVGTGLMNWASDLVRLSNFIRI